MEYDGYNGETEMRFEVVCGIIDIGVVKHGVVRCERFDRIEDENARDIAFLAGCCFGT